MRFPLSIITGYLAEQGVEVLKEAVHADNPFSWITPFPEDSDPTDTSLHVHVAGAHARIFPDDIHLFVLRPDESPETISEAAVGADDMVIRTALPCEKVADQILYYLIKVSQWNDEMGEMVESGCVSQDLLRASEPILKSYIGLSDSTFSYIAHTPQIPPVDKLSAYFVKHRCYPPESVDAARDRGLVRRWHSQDWTAVRNEPSEFMPFPTISHVIKRHGRYGAHLLLVSQTPIGSTTSFLFDLLAKRIEACLIRHWHRENPLNQRYTYFFHDLLMGNIADTQQVRELAEAQNLPLHGLFEICVVDDAWKSGSVEYFAKRAVETHPDFKVAIHESSVAVMLSAPTGAYEHLQELERALFEVAKDMKIQMGMSDHFENLEEASLALEKAQIALKYGRMKSNRYVKFDGPDAVSSYVFRFERYFVYFALDPYGRSEQFIAKFLASPHPLAKLIATDRERGTNDAEILRVYLHSEGRLNLVCSTMHLHRNTAAYRLDKIRELVHANLEDADTRMYLRTLFHMMD